MSLFEFWEIIFKLLSILSSLCKVFLDNKILKSWLADEITVTGVLSSWLILAIKLLFSILTSWEIFLDLFNFSLCFEVLWECISKAIIIHTSPIKAKVMGLFIIIEFFGSLFFVYYI